MAKIGTAHVEIKPVLSDEALDALCERIADAVAEGVHRGYVRAHSKPRVVQNITVAAGQRIEDAVRSRTFADSPL